MLGVGHFQVDDVGVEGAFAVDELEVEVAAREFGVGQVNIELSAAIDVCEALKAEAEMQPREGSVRGRGSES